MVSFFPTNSFLFLSFPFTESLAFLLDTFPSVSSVTHRLAGGCQWCNFKYPDKAKGPDDFLIWRILLICRNLRFEHYIEIVEFHVVKAFVRAVN